MDVRKLRFPLNPQLFGEKEEKKEDKEPEKEGAKEPEETDTVALAKALKEAKENSVSKEEYDALKKENSRLINEVINGGDNKDDNGHKETPVDNDAYIEGLKKKLYGPNCSELNNLEYWKNTLALREAVIKKGDPDPFLPIGAKITPDKDDEEKAQRVADVVQQCIDESDGNSEVFTALLQSRTNPDSPQMAMRLKKLGIKYN